MRLSSEGIAFAASVVSTSPTAFFEALALFPGTSVKRIHVDVMDGDFVPRLGLYPEFVNEIRSLTDLPIDAHMMMTNPEPYFRTFVDAGVTRIVPHIEPLHHVHRTLDSIRCLGAEAGLALNPHTNFGGLQYIATELEAVTVMAINPGVVGHRFISSTYGKITDLRLFLTSNGFRGVIEVDGGVTFDNIAQISSSGADVLVVGAGTLFHPGGSTRTNLSALNVAALAD